jgi:hypothetical protein
MAESGRDGGSAASELLSHRIRALVDSRFNFLSTAYADLLNEILTRRNPTLLERIRQANSVSRSDAEEIMSIISDEFTKNLDDNWEPTEYGQAVSALLAQFNAACINEWS